MIRRQTCSRIRQSFVVIAGIAGVTLLVTAGGSSAKRSTDRCSFDFPVGPPDGEGYYDAQPFGMNDHLGNDWNGNYGGNSDLGDPVHAVADGIVLESIDYEGGWGNVVRIAHECDGRVESLYAHLDAVEVMPGQPVERGQRIGTIGTAHGRYLAHLHFEIRDGHLPLGEGYSAHRAGYLDPTGYIRNHRP